MKVIMQLRFICAMALILPSLSFAGGFSGFQLVRQIEVNHTATVLLWGEKGDWNNPDFCDSSEFIILLPDDAGGNPLRGYSELYAFLVANYLQGKPINGYLSGCFIYGGGTVSYPRFYSLKLY